MTKMFSSLFLFLAVVFSTTAQQRQFCKQIGLINDLIATHHINPKPINDSLSAQVWQNFIDKLDPGKRFFTEADIGQFKEDKYALDDYFNKNKCRFIKKYIDVFEKRIDENIDILENFYGVDFNYSSSDSLYFDSTKTGNYSSNNKEKGTDWLRSMKYETVIEAAKRLTTKDQFLQSFDSIKPDIKAFVLDRNICSMNEIKQHQNGFDNYVHELFLNSLATVYDPHSIFFNNAEKSAFDSSYSSNSLTFGIETDRNQKGQIVISYVNANSPASLDKKIEAGDILRSLKSNGKKLATNCLSKQEVMNFLSNKSHKTIEFEIENSRGQIRFVTLTKAVIPVEYNAVDALVSDRDFKAGYVNLPSFYINSESNDWRGTSLDMGKALYKLVQDNIDGLLIDLRQNGGGSMKEAIDLANLFLDGPISILKQKKDIITVYNDKAAQFFNKPIVIIVDQYSASSAELFAAAMQDYQRAVIVGSSTFGKASSQDIFPLDSENDELGFLKITSELFYRVTGESHQKTGLIPDVEIVSLFNGLIDKEVDYQYILEADILDISENIESQNLPIQELRALSYKRQDSSEVFQKIKDLNINLKKNVVNKKTAYPFLPEKVFDDYKQYENIWDSMSSYFQDKEFLTFRLTSTDIGNKSEDELSRLNTLKEYASSDPIILESYLILKDLYELTEN